MITLKEYVLWGEKEREREYDHYLPAKNISRKLIILKIRRGYDIDLRVDKDFMMMMAYLRGNKES